MIRATDTKAALFSLIQWEGARKAAAEKVFFFGEEISSSNFRHVEIRLQVYPDSQSKERYLQTMKLCPITMTQTLEAPFLPHCLQRLFV